MTKVNNIKLLLVIFGSTLVSGAAQADSLLEVYQQALQSDPLIHEAEARRLAAFEAEPQARSLYLPQIDFAGDYTKVNQTGENVGSDSGGPFVEDITNKTQGTRWQFNLRQSLFRWDQIVGMRRADKIVARAEANREAAQQDLIVRVTQRYFDVLAAEDRLTSIHANKQAIARQLEQAKQRFDVGLIAITDVQESQAAYDQSTASEIGAKRTLATSREFLREITGEYVTSLSAPVDEFPLNTPDPADEASWIDLSLSQNLALVASRLDEQIANDEISFQRTGHYPRLELIASVGETDNTTDRIFNGIGPFPADSEGSNDTIGIQLTIPIFAGGGTNSRVREAVYLHRASRNQLQRVTRETERQARDAYLGVLSEISRVQALERSVESSTTALEATQAGFDVGTRTIVDVLDSQFALYVSITNFYQARYDYILNAMRLRQAAGTLQVQDLEGLDRWLEDRTPPEQVIAEEEAAAAASTT
jgi:outer membrane protein